MNKIVIFSHCTSWNLSHHGMRLLDVVFCVFSSPACGLSSLVIVRNAQAPAGPEETRVLGGCRVLTRPFMSPQSLPCTLGMLNITLMKVLAPWRFASGGQAQTFPKHPPSPCTPREQSRPQQKVSSSFLKCVIILTFI